MVLGDVKKPSSSIYRAAVNQNGYAIKYIPKELMKEYVFDAIRSRPFVLYYLRFYIELTPELCFYAVSKKGLVLKFVCDQTEKICLTAVKENGRALMYVKEQTEEICMAAVKENGRALKYVKKQTPEICEAAVKQDIYAERYNFIN